MKVHTENCGKLRNQWIIQINKTGITDPSIGDTPHFYILQEFWVTLHPLMLKEGCPSFCSSYV